MSQAKNVAGKPGAVEMPTSPADPSAATIPASFPNGHFYSPVVDPATLDPSALWPDAPEVVGIDFNDASHIEILKQAFPRFASLYDYPDRLEESPTLTRFFTENSQFSWLDARTLFVMLHLLRPRRIVEVGSGYSSLLMSDVNERFFDRGIDLTCVEPYPRPFLAHGLPEVSRLLTARVQEVGLDLFAGLEAGDVLFIDSSHVAKTGSDVNFLFFEVFPRLAPGVYVHVHDIFLPHEYPRDWVMELNRSWNEQYLLRALLQGGCAFEVVFGCSYAYSRFPELVVAALNRPDGAGFGGGSFWMRRTGYLA
jgi:hypothetical protein